MYTCAYVCACMHVRIGSWSQGLDSLHQKQDVCSQPAQSRWRRSPASNSVGGSAHDLLLTNCTWLSANLKWPCEMRIRQRQVEEAPGNVPFRADLRLHKQFRLRKVIVSTYQARSCVHGLDSFQGNQLGVYRISNVRLLGFT